MNNLISNLKGKAVHIVGVTGSEGSSILRFMKKNMIKNIYVHDYSIKEELEASFKQWHKGISNIKKEKLYKQFTKDISTVKQYFGKDYLKNILKADIIFVPQSWRLYKDKNSLLFQAKKNNIPFYNLTRLYLEHAKAKIIGITGTVGKGSVANLIVQLLEKLGKKVYFAGNDTWTVQLADRLDEMCSHDFLVLEISHRQLLDGITKAPEIVVITNIYPNHLDELTFDEYIKAKQSLLITQNKSDIAVLNYDNEILRKLAREVMAEVVFCSEERIDVNTKDIQKIFPYITNNKSTQYNINIVLACTVIKLLGIKSPLIIPFLNSLKSLPARLEKVGEIDGINFYNDVKSTTPWATLKAAGKIGKNTILICGGETKNIDYKFFSKEIKIGIKQLIILKSSLEKQLSISYEKSSLTVFSNLEQAMRYAYSQAQSGDNILISPSAAFFYSKFIKNKKSIRKIVTSLPPKEKA